MTDRAQLQGEWPGNGDAGTRPGRPPARPIEPGEPGRPEPPRPRRRRRLLVRTLLAAFAGLILLAAGSAGLLYERQSAYDDNIQRVPDALPTGGDRPAVVPAAAKAQNWLLVGSDTRVLGGTTGNGSDGWRYGEQRSDTLMVVHLSADRKQVDVISFPRDSWVDVPGHGRQKINAAFSFGGPTLLIKTIERLTGIRIDHYAAIDFDGFRDMVNAVGDIQVTIDRSVHDPVNEKSWKAGLNTMDGERAMWFVRQRFNLPGGDFDRIKRQQAVLRALAAKATSSGTISNPLRLNRFLEAFTKSITVDDSLSAGRLRSLAVSLRGLRTSDIAFLTVPNDGSAMRGGQSVVLLDAAKAKLLYSAVRHDRMAAYLRDEGGANRLGTVS